MLSRHALKPEEADSRQGAQLQATKIPRCCFGPGRPCLTLAPPECPQPRGFTALHQPLRAPGRERRQRHRAHLALHGAAGRSRVWGCRAVIAATHHQGPPTSPNSLSKLSFSTLALCTRLVFLEVSAKAVQTFPKMRLGKNQVALPKLYIFPSFTP